jgi:hypothetical protein
MEKPIEDIVLANGVRVRYYDRTRRYFGDYQLVRVEVRCDVPVREEYFAGTEVGAAARSALGAVAVYRRTMERMGVPTGEVRGAVDELIALFTEHTLTYISGPGFPRRLVVSEALRVGRKRGTFCPPPA